MSDLKPFYANADGWIAGRRVKADDKVMLTDAQARYENVRTTKSRSGDTAPEPKASGKSGKSDA